MSDSVIQKFIEYLKHLMNKNLPEEELQASKQSPVEIVKTIRLDLRSRIMEVIAKKRQERVPLIWDELRRLLPSIAGSRSDNR